MMSARLIVPILNLWLLNFIGSHSLSRWIPRRAMALISWPIFTAHRMTTNTKASESGARFFIRNTKRPTAGIRRGTLAILMMHILERLLTHITVKPSRLRGCHCRSVQQFHEKQNDHLNSRHPLLHTTPY